jgi:hypothetical protein
MRMLAEYLDKAIHFEQMASVETDPELKAKLSAQAQAYRKLVEERAKREGLPLPPPQSN